MFYGSEFDLIDLPLPRDGLNHDWALLHEESPKNVPALSHLQALELFNLTATFSRYSHFPLTLQYLKSADVLTGKYTNGLSNFWAHFIHLHETIQL
jgi:alpha-1,3-fucosyltransferase 10